MIYTFIEEVGNWNEDLIQKLEELNISHILGPNVVSTYLTEEQKESLISILYESKRSNKSTDQ
mgnify:CR=1 FL=1